MKILFFTRRYAPEIGGVETHVQEITKRLINSGHSVTIITEKPSGSKQSLSDNSAGVEGDATVYRIPITKSEKQKKFEIWKWLWKHRSHIKDADIIHVHDVFFWYLPFRFYYPHKKIYVTFHGYETVFPPRAGAIKQRKLAARLSQGNINVGDFIKKWYGTNPAFVTYGGTNVKVSPLSQQKNNKKLHILFVGRMEADTGVSMYVELLKLLKENKVEFSFTGIGDGSLKLQFAEYGKMPGFLSDTSEEMERADVIFASSYLTMLDAIAQKKLVVALYNNPLKQDYLTLSPFVQFMICEGSAEKAYEQLKFFILNPNRLHDTLRDGATYARTQTWDKVVNIYLKLWKK